MRSRFGEKTAKILLALTRRDMSAEKVADATKSSTTSVSTILLRLLGYGQVERKRHQDGTVVVDEDEGIERPRYVFVYSITEKGRDRLERITEK